VVISSETIDIVYRTSSSSHSINSKVSGDRGLVTYAPLAPVCKAQAYSDSCETSDNVTLRSRPCELPRQAQHGVAYRRDRVRASVHLRSSADARPSAHRHSGAMRRAPRPAQAPRLAAAAVLLMTLAGAAASVSAGVAPPRAAGPPPASAAAAWAPLRLEPGPRAGIRGARGRSPRDPRLLREAGADASGASDAYVVDGGTRLGYYTASLSVGSPPKSFNLILDSGSSLTVVPCKPCQCGYHLVRAVVENQGQLVGCGGVVGRAEIVPRGVFKPVKQKGREGAVVGLRKIRGYHGEHCAAASQPASQPRPRLAAAQQIDGPSVRQPAGAAAWPYGWRPFCPPHVCFSHAYASTNPNPHSNSHSLPRPPPQPLLQFCAEPAV
jgi:hypothetical protein